MRAVVGSLGKQVEAQHHPLAVFDLIEKSPGNRRDPIRHRVGQDDVILGKEQIDWLDMTVDLKLRTWIGAKHLSFTASRHKGTCIGRVQLQLQNRALAGLLTEPSPGTWLG